MAKMRKRVVIHRTLEACRRYAVKHGCAYMWQGDDLRWHAVQSGASVPTYALEVVKVGT